MSRALVLKMVRDHRLLFALVFTAAVVLPILVIVALSATPIELVSQWMRLPLVRNFFRMLLGADLTHMMNRTSYAAFAFVHPVMLSLVWAFLIVACTAVPAGEMDRGTADLLLSLPLSRWRVYLSASAVVACFGMLLAIAPWLGSYLSEWVKAWPEPLLLSRLLLVVLNDLAAIWAVAGVGMAVSACCSRRGVAVAILFGWLLSSFALNFLGALWKPAERLVFLSLLNYFRPLVIIRDQRLDASDLVVLLAVAATSWVLGGVIFARRDIRTT
jgi:ABC-2 type transport system permease protein